MDLSLQPKQAEVYNSLATEILYGGAAGSGKALSLTTEIPTTEGWKFMYDVHVGDVVFDENGFPCNVVAESEVMYDRPCYEVTFDCGETVIADRDHQWYINEDWVGTTEVLSLEKGPMWVWSPVVGKTNIVSVKETVSVAVKCIQVDSPNSLYLCTKNFIPTHNSHLMRILAIAYCVDIAGLQVYLFRRTSPDLIANHLSGPSGFPTLLAEWVEQKFVTINYSKNEIRFWNGSVIHLCHCQHEKDKYSYQGAEIHVLLMDELTHFTESIYRYLRGRVRLGGLKIPDKYREVMPRIVCGSNPGGEGHNWVKKTFIDFAPPNTINKTPKEEGGFKRAFFPAKLSDNKVLTENDPDYEDRLSGLGTEQLVQAMKDGNWDIAAGGYFDDVWMREKHVLKPFDIPSSWLIDRSFDWGSSKPFSVGYWAESDGTYATLPDGTRRYFPKGSVIRIAEIYGWNGNADEGCRKTAKEIAVMIKEFEASVPWGKRVRPGAADSAIYVEENGDCIAKDMKAEDVTWIPADKKPGSRMTGWQTVYKMLKAALNNSLEDPGLWVFDTCIHFIRTVPTLPRDPNNVEDVYSKSEDHVGDEVRYRLNTKRQQAGFLKVVGT